MPYGYALLCGTIFLVFQKAANRLVKDGLSQGKRPSFTRPKGLLLESRLYPPDYQANTNGVISDVEMLFKSTQSAGLFR